MARLEKRERQRRRAKGREIHNLPLIQSNLSTPKPEMSNILSINLRRKGAEVFHYPWLRASSTPKKKNKSSYIAPQTGLVGYRLDQRKNKKILTTVEWKGKFAR